MAAPIGPGDWVETVNPNNSPVEPGGAFRLGELCVVEAVGTDWYGPSINCIGKPRPDACGYSEWGWPLLYFRPIYRPRADFIESLKAPPKRAPREVEPA